MSLPSISAPAPAPAPARAAVPAPDRSRRDERSMRLAEGAIALLAIRAAVLLSLAR